MQESTGFQDALGQRARLQQQINFFEACLDEISRSESPEDRALYPIYQGFLDHCQGQLRQLGA